MCVRLVQVRALVTESVAVASPSLTGRFDRLQAAQLYIGHVQFGYFLSQIFRGQLELGDNKVLSPAQAAQIQQRIENSAKEMRSEVAWAAASRRAGIFFELGRDATDLGTRADKSAPAPNESSSPRADGVETAEETEGGRVTGEGKSGLAKLLDALRSLFGEGNAGSEAMGVANEEPTGGGEGGGNEEPVGEAEKAPEIEGRNADQAVQPAADNLESDGRIAAAGIAARAGESALALEDAPLGFEQLREFTTGVQVCSAAQQEEFFSALAQNPELAEQMASSRDEGALPTGDFMRFNAAALQCLLAEACLYGWHLWATEAHIEAELNEEASTVLLQPPQVAR